MLQIAGRAESVFLGTATPIQIDRMELYDLMRILHRGCERILGGIGSNWRHEPREAMDLVAGRSEPPTSIAELWAWLRDPLIPRGEHPLATQIRADLAVPDSQTAASVDALESSWARPFGGVWRLWVALSSATTIPSSATSSKGGAATSRTPTAHRSFVRFLFSSMAKETTTRW